MKRSLGSDIPKIQNEFGCQIETAEQKAERNRERNREHAKKTRLRKKEMIEGMKMRLLELQRESVRLEELLEESNTANILLCLGGKNDPSASSSTASSSPRFASFSSASSICSNSKKEEFELQEGVSVSKGNIIDQLKQKVRSEAALHTNKDQYVSSSEHGFGDFDGDEEEEDSLEPTATHCKGSEGEVDVDIQNRRARNRMHAKLTRDRKKLLTNKMQETIQMLERHNEQLKVQLNQITKPSIIVSTLPNLNQAYDPLTTFCYYAELWNKANEAMSSTNPNKTIESH